MTTTLTPIENGVNLLKVCGVTLLSIDDVDAWLYALDLQQGEREQACKHVLGKGFYAVSNMRYRVTAVFSQ